MKVTARRIAGLVPAEGRTNMIRTVRLRMRKTYSLAESVIRRHTETGSFEFPPAAMVLLMLDEREGQEHAFKAAELLTVLNRTEKYSVYSPVHIQTVNQIVSQINYEISMAQGMRGPEIRELESIYESLLGGNAQGQEEKLRQIRERLILRREALEKELFRRPRDMRTVRETLPDYREIWRQSVAYCRPARELARFLEKMEPERREELLSFLGEGKTGLPRVLYRMKQGEWERFSEKLSGRLLMEERKAAENKLRQRELLESLTEVLERSETGEEDPSQAIYNTRTSGKQLIYESVEGMNGAEWDALVKAMYEKRPEELVSRRFTEVLQERNFDEYEKQTAGKRIGYKKELFLVLDQIEDRAADEFSAAVLKLRPFEKMEDKEKADLQYIAEGMKRQPGELAGLAGLMAEAAGDENMRRQLLEGAAVHADELSEMIGFMDETEWDRLLRVMFEHQPEDPLSRRFVPALQEDTFEAYAACPVSHRLGYKNQLLALIREADRENAGEQKRGEARQRPNIESHMTRLLRAVAHMNGAEWDALVEAMYGGRETEPVSRYFISRLRLNTLEEYKKLPAGKRLEYKEELISVLNRISRENGGEKGAVERKESRQASRGASAPSQFQGGDGWETPPAEGKAIPGNTSGLTETIETWAREELEERLEGLAGLIQSTEERVKAPRNLPFKGGTSELAERLSHEIMEMDAAEWDAFAETAYETGGAERIIRSFVSDFHERTFEEYKSQSAKKRLEYKEELISVLNRISRENDGEKGAGEREKSRQAPRDAFEPSQFQGGDSWETPPAEGKAIWGNTSGLTETIETWGREELKEQLEGLAGLIQNTESQGKSPGNLLSTGGPAELADRLSREIAEMDAAEWDAFAEAVYETGGAERIVRSFVSDFHEKTFEESQSMSFGKRLEYREELIAALKNISQERRVTLSAGEQKTPGKTGGNVPAAAGFLDSDGGQGEMPADRRFARALHGRPQKGYGSPLYEERLGRKEEILRSFSEVVRRIYKKTGNLALLEEERETGLPGAGLFRESGVMNTPEWDELAERMHGLEGRALDVRRLIPDFHGRAHGEYKGMPFEERPEGRRESKFPLPGEEEPQENESERLREFSSLLAQTAEAFGDRSLKPLKAHGARAEELSEAVGYLEAAEWDMLVKRMLEHREREPVSRRFIEELHISRYEDYMGQKTEMRLAQKGKLLRLLDRIGKEKKEGGAHNGFVPVIFSPGRGDGDAEGIFSSYQPPHMVTARGLPPSPGVASPAPSPSDIEFRTAKRDSGHEDEEGVNDIRFSVSRPSFTTAMKEYKSQMQALSGRIEEQMEQLEELKRTQDILIKNTDTEQMTARILGRLQSQLRLEKMRRGL